MTPMTPMTLTLDGGPFDGCQLSIQVRPAQVIVVRGVDVQGYRDLRQPAEYQVGDNSRAHFVDYIRPGARPAPVTPPAPPAPVTARKELACRHRWIWATRLKAWVCALCQMRERAGE